MWLGYLTYPKTYLTEADKAKLAASKFIYGGSRRGAVGAAGRAR